MKKVLIIDYDMGNIDSISRAIEECGGESIVSNRYSDFEQASLIILPGVGSFTKALKNLLGLVVEKLNQNVVFVFKVEINRTVGDTGLFCDL